MIKRAGHKPLSGYRVVVTRATEQAPELTDKLAELGADVASVPTIEIVDPSDGGLGLRSSIRTLSSYEWLVVTSANGARRVVEALAGTQLPDGTRLAVIGDATAAVFEQAGLRVDLIPPQFVAESLLDVFPDPTAGATTRVLIARAEVARDVLPDGLRARGFDVDVVAAYRTDTAVCDASTAAVVESADVVTFASASSVRNLVAMVGKSALPSIVVTIGPVTSQAAAEYGLTVSAEADPHTIDGLVAAVVLAVTAASTNAGSTGADSAVSD